MAFASKAQRRKFYADPRLRKYAGEFEAATTDKNLPERANGLQGKLRKKRAEAKKKHRHHRKRRRR